MEWIENVLRDVAELPDRSSPEGWPEAMSVTGAELRQIIVAHAPAEPVNVDFGMRGENMFFQIGNQSFLLDYKPEEQGEFEFMKAMLLSAFSRITHGVKTESQPVNARILDALKRAKDVAWAFEGKGSEMSAVSFLCVGGPLDGQYRAIPEGRIPFFRVAAIPNLNLLSSGAGRSVDCRIVDSVEYQLGWSEDHCRLVFRSNT